MGDGVHISTLIRLGLCLWLELLCVFTFYIGGIFSFSDFNKYFNSVFIDAKRYSS